MFHLSDLHHIVQLASKHSRERFIRTEDGHGRRDDHVLESIAMAGTTVSLDESLAVVIFHVEMILMVRRWCHFNDATFETNKYHAAVGTA
jgi:hypothetical protein